MAGRRRNINIGANSIVYSGRGRPRTKHLEDVDERPLPVGIVLGPTSPEALSDLYKNRKIRVGSAFQAKVPKKPQSHTGDHHHESATTTTPNKGVAYQSKRPAPSRVSLVHPHLTERQVQEEEGALTLFQQPKRETEDEEHEQQQGKQAEAGNLD